MVSTKMHLSRMSVPVFFLGLLCACTPKGVYYDPIPESSDFPLPEATIAEYVKSHRVSAMRSHAWQIFGAITQPSHGDPSLPRWETWYGISEVFGSATCLEDTDRTSNGYKRHELRLDPQLEVQVNDARQLARQQGLNEENVFQPLERIRYNREACRFIKENELDKAVGTLPKLYEKGIRDVAQLEGPESNRMVVVKTDFVNVRDHEPVTLAMWDEHLAVAGVNQHDSITADTADGRRHVCVSRKRSQCPDAKVPWKSPDEFYNYREGGSTEILVGLHFATREQANWVWATFWWHDKPDAKPYSAGRPRMVRSPWNHYMMNVSYDMDLPAEPDGKPHIAFNPFLEGFQPEGLTSNCMSCHRRASWSAKGETCITFASMNPTNGTLITSTNPGFVAVRGEAATLGTYFNEPYEERLKLGFLWSLKTHSKDPQPEESCPPNGSAPPSTPPAITQPKSPSK